MKKLVLTSIILTLCAVSTVFAQTETKVEKKARKEAEKTARHEKNVVKMREDEKPQLKVVELQPVVSDSISPAPAAKPANGSLFTDGAAGGSLLTDFKARRIGDLVFVNVVETNSATVTSAANRSRDSGNLGGIVPLVSALPVSGAATAGSVLTNLGQRKFEGKGTTDRTSNVRSRITARVVEVLPNGDLRIQALKLVKINKETEQLAVTGIVRPNDLDKDNSIETFSVGDLRVEFNGKGIASADNAPGWLFRLFEKISPF